METQYLHMEGGVGREHRAGNLTQGHQAARWQNQDSKLAFVSLQSAPWGGNHRILIRPVRWFW